MYLSCDDVKTVNFNSVKSGELNYWFKLLAS